MQIMRIAKMMTICKMSWMCKQILITINKNSKENMHVDIRV